MRNFIACLMASYAIAATITNDDNSGRSAPIGGYDYRQGGEDWGTIYGADADATGYLHTIADNICGATTSVQQSPIDLSTTTGLTKDNDMEFSFTGFGTSPKDYRDKLTTQMEINWEITFEGDWVSSAEFSRTDAKDSTKDYTPVQIHIHAPSEHTVDGVHYDAEAHLVTQDSDGNYAVFGVLFDSSNGAAADNNWIASYKAAYGDRFNYDTATNSDNEGKVEMDMNLLLNAVDESDAWMYDGSFTTPPCTEGVAWTVYQKVQPISTAQLTWLHMFSQGTATGGEATQVLAKYQTYVQSNTANVANGAGNNRKPQPLGDRKLFKYDATLDEQEDDGASALTATFAAIAALSFLSF